MPSPPDHSPEEDPLVSMADVTRFVRQLSHDLRNHLNAAELQSAYIGEVTEDAEMQEEVKRLRGMLGEMGASLQRLTNSLAIAKLTLMPYEAANFMEDLRQKIEQQLSEQSAEIEWKVETDDALLQIDPQALQSALVELFVNAFQHERAGGPLRASATVNGSDFVFTLAEPKTSFGGETENWGRRPFAKVIHGHYGLGLPRVRRIVEAHQGKLGAQFDAAAGSLVTTVVLPLEKKA